MPKRTKKLSRTARPGLKIEALEQRQLLATGFTDAQGQQFSDIVHQNGNVYDQVLLKSSAITVINDPGQITRVSFLDLEGDIVQAEFSGAGQLSISLSNFSGPAEATKYNQPGIQYVSGLASFTIQGSDATTNFTVFSVGTDTAHGKAENPIFAGGKTGGDNTADIQRITIVADPSNPNGSTFGGIRAGNAEFSGSTGVVGITAANVHVQDVVIIGDVDASGTAIPTLIFGANSQFGGITVAGGNLVQTSGVSISNTGSYPYMVTLAAGSTSGGTALPAATTGSQIQFTGDNPFAQVNNTFTLTTGVDTIPGLVGTAGTTTNGDDTVNATIGGDDPTLTGLDSINTGNGNDQMNLVDLDGGEDVPAGVTVENLEVVNFRSVGAATIDISDWPTVTKLNVTQATSANLDVPDTTALTVTGVTGAIATTGGSTVNVTHSKQAGNNITIDDGTTVTVTAQGRAAGTITIGGTTEPSGAVTVTATGAAYTKDTGDTTLGAIAVTGGTTVSITQSATSSSTAAATDTDNKTITQGAVTVTGGDDTTSVIVIQDAAVTAEHAETADAGSKEVAVVTFAAMAKDQTIIIGEGATKLTFTASKALTAAEAAAAFANLAASATHGSAAASSGIYSGTFSDEYTSGAVVTSGGTSKVTFTATKAAAANDLTVTDGSVDPTITITQGEAPADAETGVMGIAGGAVTITDGGDDSITTVTLSGYANSAITSDLLATLSLAKSNFDLTINNGSAKTLGLTVDGVGVTGDHAIVDDASGTYTTINLTATGTNSFIALDAVAVETMTVAGSKVVNLTNATLDALKTLTVSGSAGVTIDGDQADTLTSVDASGTSGAVTASIDPTKATYTGGSGVDTVTTVTGTTPSKAINLGAGDDVLNLAAGTTSSTSELNGGDGTDTLGMSAANAATASQDATFESKITSFEKLSVGAVAVDTTPSINLENLDDISYVIVTGAAAAAVSEVFTVTFTGGGTLAAGHTLVFDGVTTTGDADPTIAELVAAAADQTYANWTVTATDDATQITFTAKAAGAKTDVAAGAFTGTAVSAGGLVATPVTGTQGSDAGTLTFTKMANAGTLELTAAGAGATVTMKDATGSSDVLNVVTKNGSDTTFGTVGAAGVETINLTATDTSSSTINIHTLTLSAGDATTVNVTGNAHVTLNLAAATDSLTKLDGSAMTGKLTASTNGVVAQTILGGSGADSLTANFQADLLNGGGGADTLVVMADLVTLTGGAGNDVFNVGDPTTNVNSYATVTDLAAGDRIKFSTLADNFASAKITLDPTTAVFQDYANAAINASDQGDVLWFQYNGNTYVIEHRSGDAATSFVNGTDVIVKINGLVDLSAAAFSSSDDTLLIV